MLYLITGTPGSGKTLSAIEIIRRTRIEQPDRIIYAANITGLNIPGVIQLDDEGVLAWHEACEKNSLILVDEAQRYWRAQRSGEPSKAIIEMETHRHDGIDIVMMTQHPTFLHSNIRKLINVHIHLVAYTKSSALRWEWRECHDDIQEAGLRALGEFKEWNYDPALYDDYTSSTQHTKRAKRPIKQTLARVTLWALGVGLVLGVFGFGIWAYRTHGMSDLKAATVQPAGSVGLPNTQPPGPKVLYATTRDYVAAQIPRVSSQPWSAPLYDSAAVTRHPRVFCMSIEPPGKCRCVTEQGTHYVVNDLMCRDMAKNGGPYDPYLPLPPPPVAPGQTMPNTYATAAPSQGLSVSMPSSGGRGDYAGVGEQAYQPPTYRVPIPFTHGGK